MQVVDVTDSSVVWSEAAMMRHCSHERIVPLYGVASKVGGVAGGLDSVVLGVGVGCSGGWVLWVDAAPGAGARFCCYCPTCGARLRCMHVAQGPLMFLAMELMLGGSLQAAIIDPEKRQQLQWHAR